MYTNSSLVYYKHNGDDESYEYRETLWHSVIQGHFGKFCVLYRWVQVFHSCFSSRRLNRLPWAIYYLFFLPPSSSQYSVCRFQATRHASYAFFPSFILQNKLLAIRPPKPRYVFHCYSQNQNSVIPVTDIGRTSGRSDTVTIFICSSFLRRHFFYLFVYYYLMCLSLFRPQKLIYTSNWIKTH